MGTNKPKNTIAAAEKVLNVLFALRGHYFAGISNQQLARQLNESPANITRALQTLVANGWAEERAGSLYAPSMHVVKFAASISEEVRNAEARIAEFKQRVNVSIR